METTDIPPALTENCAHPPNHSGYITIPHHQHVAMGNGLDVKAVNLGNAALAGLLPVTKESAGKTVFTSIRNNACANRRHRIRSRAFVRSRHRNPALLCD